MPKKICRDCISGKKAKVRLACSHTVCEDCISQYAATHFSNNVPYAYLGFCSTCKRAEKIRKSAATVEGISLECGCHWTEVGKKIENIIEFDGKRSRKRRDDKVWEMRPRTHAEQSRLPTDQRLRLRHFPVLQNIQLLPDEQEQKRFGFK